ncbi:SDR family oxidoreductase [Sphingomonas sp.]|uniref:SDR family oxidoreductase n=1 Tax=Sphingomonas sp. TaxID=28214 RepID=UPI001B018284|nr:SDR family oxidoreductase [Sphingomonas sp.]MBO9712996.1 SDR family oxidoreductase [Sphingomonas sp.]
MRVFVTGATGFVGSAVVAELIGAGHQVVGLVRSEAKAPALAAAGAEVLLGSIGDAELLQNAAAAADGVIHTAFNHDFSRYAENAAEDHRAILALGEGLVGTAKPLLVTAGTALVRQGPTATEADPHWPRSERMPRASEDAAEALAARGVHAGTVRLPPSTHGVGDHGFVRILHDLAKRTGVSAYPGDGANRWSSGHRRDAARVYRLALEHGGLGGPFHAIAEEGVPMRAIAEVIGAKLGVPVVSKSPEEAAEHFGWFAMFASADLPTSSAHTRALLGWEPRELGLLEDLAQADYFED